jgi:peptidyl-dipeptidase Dcp
VRALLEQVWAPARARTLTDRDDLQALIAEEGGNFKLAPWDWRYYAGKLRKRRLDLDEAAIKPYLQLDRIIEAAFDTAQRLFGLTFAPVEVPVWHPDVRAFEVSDAQGRHLGLFFGDYFARVSKHGGAWMTTLRDQRKLDGDIRPLVVNVMNFNKGEPTLLSIDDARTLFHEFGHALHALLSDVTYPMVSGTNVLTDFVELPSQLYEHWLEQPQVLRRFARHVRTEEAIPEPLLQKLIAARTFDRARETLEYLASAFFDLDLHEAAPGADAAERIDIKTIEQAQLDKLGMPAEIAMRHRPPHFAHVFSGGGYASAYYSYLWSEVLDADAFNAFEEVGDIFDPATAQRLKEHIYAAGGTRDPEALYIAFRGRLPTADALLRKRGFADGLPVG